MSKLIRHKCHTTEISLYLGGQVGYTDQHIDKGELVGAIWAFQSANRNGWQPPVRITETEFVADGQYRERGWEVTATNYPPNPSTQLGQVLEYVEGLAQHLMRRFGQRRVTVVGPNMAYTLEDPDIEPRRR